MASYTILGFWAELASIGAALLIVVLIGFLILLVNCYKKVEQGTAVVRNGVGGTRVSFSGIFVIPVFHRSERMDISVKRIEIYRHGAEGLICSDNIRVGRAAAGRAVRRQVFRSPQDGRQTVRFRRSVQLARAVQGRDSQDHRHGLERLRARRRGDRLPRTDADRKAQSG
jgi:hypothetical protein